MQLQQLTCVTEKCLIQHATSTFACPLCELRATELKSLFIKTELFLATRKFSKSRVSNNQLSSIENITSIDVDYDYVHDMLLCF
jgi:hypothetical protein